MMRVAFIPTQSASCEKGAIALTDDAASRRPKSKFNARAAARRFPYREHRSCAKWIGGLSA